MDGKYIRFHVTEERVCENHTLPCLPLGYHNIIVAAFPRPGKGNILFIFHF